MVDTLLKKLNEQCPGNGSQWYADVDGCGQYIFLWARGRTAIKIYPRPYSKMDDDGNITVGVNWFINPENEKLNSGFNVADLKNYDCYRYMMRIHDLGQCLEATKKKKETIEKIMLLCNAI